MSSVRRAKAKVFWILFLVVCISFFFLHYLFFLFLESLRARRDIKFRCMQYVFVARNELWHKNEMHFMTAETAQQHAKNANQIAPTTTMLKLQQQCSSFFCRKTFAFTSKFYVKWAISKKNWFKKISWDFVFSSSLLPTSKWVRHTGIWHITVCIFS